MDGFKTLKKLLEMSLISLNMESPNLVMVKLACTLCQQFLQTLLDVCHHSLDSAPPFLDHLWIP